MNKELRSEFFKILGETYKELGFPEIFGWIEGLLTLQKTEISQKEISNQLTSIFNEPDNPTSVSSVNRSLKVMESYGIILKQGTRKIRYTYKFNPDYNMITNTFHVVMNITKLYLDKISRLKEEPQMESDTELIKSIENQVKMYSNFSEFLEEMLESIKNKKNL
jgi:DNA-binding transcriptional regulator GbsR (MarR family)